MTPSAASPGMKEYLDRLYDRYNRQRFVRPDPVQFLYRYKDMRDREIAGLIASSLAYGRVTQIIRSIASVLNRMQPSPFLFLSTASEDSLTETFSGFRHRFTDGRELTALLAGIKAVMARHGSLHRCFTGLLRSDDETFCTPLAAFVEELKGSSGSAYNSLLPSPAKGSACKRLNLFLRWMVRSDAVDPGGWSGLSAAHLVVPLDTHMHRIGRDLGFTERKQADMKTAREITDCFKRIRPEDPVRYDFALTRLGIRSDVDPGKYPAVAPRAGAAEPLPA